jgi:hypothetical protein
MPLLVMIAVRVDGVRVAHYNAVMWMQIDPVEQTYRVYLRSMIGS